MQIPRLIVCSDHSAPPQSPMAVAVGSSGCFMKCMSMEVRGKGRAHSPGAAEGPWRRARMLPGFHQHQRPLQDRCPGGPGCAAPSAHGRGEETSIQGRDNPGVEAALAAGVTLPPPGTSSPTQHKAPRLAAFLPPLPRSLSQTTAMQAGETGHPGSSVEDQHPAVPPPNTSIPHPTTHTLSSGQAAEAQGQTQKAAQDPPLYLHCAKHLVLYVSPAKLLLHGGSGGSIQHLQPHLPAQGWQCCHTGAPGTTEVPSARSHHPTTASTHLSLSWEHPPSF